MAYHVHRAEPPYGTYDFHLVIGEAFGDPGDPTCICCKKAIEMTNHWVIEGGTGKSYCNTIVCSEECATMYMMQHI